MKYSYQVLKLISVIILLSSCGPASKGPITKTKKSAILIEGLASHGLGFLRNQYTQPLESQGFEVYSEPHTYNLKITADLCITHSFGWRAVRNGANCRLLIVMDGRAWDFYNNAKFKKPDGVDIMIVYYQDGWPNGNPIEGATKNAHIKNTSHTHLPVTVFPMVLQDIKNYL
jgi:hypothetical protein